MSAPENVTAPVNEAVAAAMDSTVPLNEKEASFKEDNVDLEGGGVLMKEDITAAEFHVGIHFAGDGGQIRPSASGARCLKR